MSYSNIIEETSAPEHRTVQRVPTELKTIVQVKENDAETWKEVTKVTTVSRNGAGFSLMRPCKVGRLVTLVMPLDPQLRAYDETAELYPVMGIVQYCNKGKIEGEAVYHVGVGFVGKQIPASFKADPTQNYRISGMAKSGLWTITEAESAFKARKHPRYWIALDVMITQLRKDKKEVNKEETFTQNLSASGVSVVCSLDSEVGDKVKFACKGLDFYAMAMVRNRKEKEGQPPTLHLEFIETTFPIERLLLAQTEQPKGSDLPPPAAKAAQFEYRWD